MLTKQEQRIIADIRDHQPTTLRWSMCFAEQVGRVEAIRAELERVVGKPVRLCDETLPTDAARAVGFTAMGGICLPTVAHVLLTLIADPSYMTAMPDGQEGFIQMDGHEIARERESDGGYLIYGAKETNK